MIPVSSLLIAKLDTFVKTLVVSEAVAGLKAIFVIRMQLVNNLILPASKIPTVVDVYVLAEEQKANRVILAITASAIPDWLVLLLALRARFASNDVQTLAMVEGVVIGSVQPNDFVYARMIVNVAQVISVTEVFLVTL